jgi:hypothetical protein
VTIVKSIIDTSFLLSRLYDCGDLAGVQKNLKRLCIMVERNDGWKVIFTGVPSLYQFVLIIVSNKNLDQEKIVAIINNIFSVLNWLA